MAYRLTPRGVKWPFVYLNLIYIRPIQWTILSAQTDMKSEACINNQSTEGTLPNY